MRHPRQPGASATASPPGPALMRRKVTRRGLKPERPWQWKGKTADGSWRSLLRWPIRALPPFDGRSFESPRWSHRSPMQGIGPNPETASAMSGVRAFSARAGRLQRMRKVNARGRDHAAGRAAMRRTCRERSRRRLGPGSAPGCRQGTSVKYSSRWITANLPLANVMPCARLPTRKLT
jgi:hypothetical protein